MVSQSDDLSTDDPGAIAMEIDDDNSSSQPTQCRRDCTDGSKASSELGQASHEESTESLSFTGIHVPRKEYHPVMTGQQSKCTLYCFTISIL